MKITVNKEPKNTYKVDVVIPLETVKSYLDEALKHEAESLQVEGFRKGHAPLEVAKQKIDQGKLKGHALNHLLPEIYSRIVKENKLNPIINPRFDIKEFDENKDLTLTVTIIEKPTIELGDYKEKLKAIKMDPENKDQNVPQEVIDTVVATGKVEIPEIIVEEEAARMLSSLIDQCGKLGITIDQYLQTYNKTLDALKAEYKLTAEKLVKTDFLISEIAAVEKIDVDEADIDATIKAIPDEATRKAFEKVEQRMYVKAILLKGKVLEWLRGLVPQIVK